MRVVYLDFETYYDSDYNLGKMGIEQYVRDARFDTYLLSYAIDDGEVLCISRDCVADELRKLRLDEPDTFTVIQNAHFDGFILSDRYGINPANPVCTRAMFRWVGGSRLTRESLAAQCEFMGTGVKGGFIQSMQGRKLDSLSQDELSQYVEYNKEDVRQLRRNFKAMLPYMTAEALAFICMSERMYTAPVFSLNKKKLLEYRLEILERQEQARQKLQELFRFESREAFLKALRSKTKFCSMLEELHGVVPLKVSEKKTETRRKETGDDSVVVYEPALAKTDIEFQNLMASEDQDIAALANARAENNSSIALSRCESFLAIADRGLLPVSLEPFLAWTGRYTASNSADTTIRSDSLNIQNLPKRTGDLTLRESINPPDGYVIVACDSSQIEARVLAWVAGQEDLLEDFRQGNDPYCRMAEAVYNEPYDTIFSWTKGELSKSGDKEKKKKYKHMRDVAKAAVLQLGYAAGAVNFSNYLWRNRIHLLPDKTTHDEEAARIVQVYRNKNDMIRRFWNGCRSVLQDMCYGQSGELGMFRFVADHNVFGRKTPAIFLPNGYPLLYPELSIEEEPDFGEGFRYTQMDKGKQVRKWIHAGQLCNNCIAEGTPVLTDSGVKSIENITVYDKVWDGVDFVSHSGVISKGVQSCINVCGVWLTPEHKLLEKGQWVRADETIRPDRAEIWEADSYWLRWKQRAQHIVDMSVRLWRNRDKNWHGVEKKIWQGSYVQALSAAVCVTTTAQAWYDAHSFLYRVAQYGKSLYERMGASLQKLWSAWYSCVRALDGIREFSRRYVCYMAQGFDFRSYRQQWRLLSRELSLGSNACQSGEQARQFYKKLYAISGRVRDCAIDNELSFASRMAGRSAVNKTEFEQQQTQITRQTYTIKKEVFDILNCGARQRFVVLGDYPMFAHNCVQGTAFALMWWQALQIHKRYSIRCNIHDSWAVVVKESEAEEAAAYMRECMTMLPSWAQGLPVACESGIGKDFRVV